MKQQIYDYFLLISVLKVVH